METTLIILISLLFGALIGSLVLFLVNRNRGSGRGNDSFLLLQNQLNSLAKTVDEKLSESHRQMHESVRSQFQESQKLIKEINEQVNRQMQEVTKGVTQVGESSKQVFTLADQLKNLEQVLTNQKRRGNLGEASLELVLSNILPPTGYKTQYAFADGQVVDAVIKTKEGVIPIDAKFSLDNYNRLAQETDDDRRQALEKEFVADLKRRVEETAKYIRPNDGTLPFAFMFIPAEAIYYDLLVNEVGSIKATTRSLIDYAYTDKNVIIVSPTTFAAYLQSVLYGFKAFRFEESAKHIQKRVEELGRHLKNYDEYYKKLGNSLATTVNHYNTGYKELNKIDKDVYRITGETPGVEPEQLEKPKHGQDEG